MEWKFALCERLLMVLFVRLELDNFIYFYSTEKGDLSILKNIFCVPQKRRTSYGNNVRVSQGIFIFGKTNPLK